MKEFNFQNFKEFDSKMAGRTIDKVSITKSNLINFPTFFFKANKLESKTHAILYYNEVENQMAIKFIDSNEPKAFKLLGDRKYGAYISAKSFLLANKISAKRTVRYGYTKEIVGDDSIYVIDLNEEGGNM